VTGVQTCALPIYPIVVCGYLLMFLGVWLILKVAYTYITSPYLAKALKIPVIMPLVPYLPDIFKIPFLPPFYFTYWIIIIAIIAIPHEFAHGIFARLNKIRILSTGFGFLGPFLAAFVEQDDKQMQKASKFSQLTVLAAGTFANLIMTLVFGLVMFLFFVSAFSPAGVNFNMYSADVINSSSISAIGTNYLDNTTLLNIKANNKTYFAEEKMLNDSLKINGSALVVFDDSPALRANLAGAIAKVDGKKITSYEILNSTLHSYKPGDNIIITTISKDKSETNYNITLAERNGNAFLGIGIAPQQRSGAFAFVYNLFDSINNPMIYYESRLGDFGIFILDLLWWTVLVSLSVALMNMLPLGLFDGGRFFYLTVWAITGREKIAKNAFKISTWFMLAVLVLMMVKWVFIFF
jgi:membrane-associated protease RseP (regulator of RpoE activity)